MTTDAVVLMTIKTVQVSPPIPCRSFDWCAYDSEGGEEGPYGWGQSEEEAKNDLREQLTDAGYWG